MPTTVPLAALSETTLAVASVSTGVVTSNSSMSVTSTVKVWVLVEPSADVAVTVRVICGSVSVDRKSVV